MTKNESGVKTPAGSLRGDLNKKLDDVVTRIFKFDILFLVTTIVVFILLLNLKFIRLFSRTNLISIVQFLTDRFWPPETSAVVQENIRFALWETIQMAFIATYFGALMSLPAALLASRNLSPSYISLPFRLFLATIRTIPSLIWALMFVIIFGLGPRAGTIALSFYTMGYLSKFQYETFEGLLSDAIEALTALGASKIQIIRYVVLPESANHLISQILFMFEYNIRAGSIIGFVGAGGLGFLLSYYLSYFQFHAMLTTLIYLLITIITIDFISGLIRKRFHDPKFDDLSV